MKIIAWNFSRLAPDSDSAIGMRATMMSASPQIVCVTEAHEASLAGLDGDTISDVGVRWSNETPAERKVLLWSAAAWTDVVHFEDLSRLGGAVGGVTHTSLGPVRVIGVCIPHWRASPAGLEPHAADWSQHTAFLERLETVLRETPDNLPIIVAGEFNQRIPAEWGVMDVRRQMERTFQGFSMVTRGDVFPPGQPATSHIALSKLLRAKSVSGMVPDDAASPLAPGVAADVEAGGVQIFD